VSEEPKFLFGFPVAKFDGYTVGMLRWTTETPTDGGTYWAWVCVKNRDSKAYPQIIDIYIHEGEIHIAWPVSGYEWDPDFEVKDITHWLGPLPVPEPPTDL
jgi:hypothetical protein